MTEQIPTIYKGLAGVVVDTTAISKVVPETNSLTYRGYAVQDLAANCSFEEVAHLLWYGELPTPEQLELLCLRERAARRADRSLLSLLTKMPDNCHPMDVVRTAISYLGAEDPAEDDNSEKANLAKALRMTAVLPTIVAADFRRRRGQDPIAPQSDLGFAENFLNMCFGAVPEPAIVKAFEVSLILYAEHSFNASTFAARVVTSTLSDIYSAVTAAIGTLKGPLHGGANEAVMHDMLEIDDPDHAEAWMSEKLAAKEKVMGFGHRVYKNGDSRVPTMKQALPRRRGSDRRREVGADVRDPREDHGQCHRNQAESRFPYGPCIFPHGLRRRDVHADLRDEPHHRMDGAHHRARAVECTDPAAEPVFGRATAHSRGMTLFAVVA